MMMIFMSIRSFWLLIKGIHMRQLLMSNLQSTKGLRFPIITALTRLISLLRGQVVCALFDSVLIEFIPGLSMQKIDPGTLTQATRQSVMKSVIEIETSAHAKDVLLEDLTPRNAMVTDPDPNSEDRRPVFSETLEIPRLAVALFLSRRILAHLNSTSTIMCHCSCDGTMINTRMISL